jgi:hypothetical protein
VQSDLALLQGRGIQIPASTITLASQVGGLVYGLLRGERRARNG